MQLARKNERSEKLFVASNHTFRVFVSHSIQFYFLFFAGKDVVGEYTIKEPGGNIRTVKYRAGKNGFFAHVFNSNGNDHDGGHHH